MSARRVLVVHNRYRSSQPSGEDRVVDQETALLAEAGHQVDLFERRSDDIAAMPLAQKAVVPLRLMWNPSVRTELGERLTRERPDIVHIHSTFPLLSAAVLAACSDAGVPAVATLHNYSMVCPTGTLFRDGRTCTDCVGRSGLAAVRHRCYRGSAAASVPVAVNMAVHRRWWSSVARFFCISDAQRRFLVGAGMPEEQLAVKYNFVADVDRRRSGPGEHVLFVGRLGREKGAHLLKQAWEVLGGRRGIGLPLVMAGAGPLEEELRAWAATRDDVSVLGLRTRAECADLTARAAVLVAPSEWPEAFGLVVAEAMAAGVPVVAAAHGAFPELVDDGTSGLLHRPGDAVAVAEAVRRIVTEPGLGARMGRQARSVYEQRFAPAVGLGRLEDEYDAVIAAAASGRPR